MISHHTQTAQRPGKVLAKTMVPLADGMAMHGVQVTLTNNGLAIGIPSRRTIKGELHIGGKIIRDAELKFQEQEFRDLTNAVIAGLHAPDRRAL